MTKRVFVIALGIMTTLLGLVAFENVEGPFDRLPADLAEFLGQFSLEVERVFRGDFGEEKLAEDGVQRRAHVLPVRAVEVQRRNVDPAGGGCLHGGQAAVLLERVEQMAVIADRRFEAARRGEDVLDRPDVIGGFHLLVNGLLACLLARLSGARSLYFCVGGPAEVLDGGLLSENRIFGRLQHPDPRFAGEQHDEPPVQMIDRHGPSAMVILYTTSGDLPVRLSTLSSRQANYCAPCHTGVRLRL